MMKPIKIMIVLGIVLLSVLAFASAFATQTDDLIAIVATPINTDCLSLHEEPSIYARSFGQYYNGTPVTVLGASGEWASVQIGAMKGYMQSEFLKYTWEAGYENPGVYAQPNENMLWGIVAKAPGIGTLTVYEEPAFESVALCDLSEGEALQILGEIDDGWLQIRTAENLIGFVRDEWVVHGVMQPNVVEYIVRSDEGAVPVLAKPSADGRMLFSLYDGVSVGCYGIEGGYALIRSNTYADINVLYGYIATEFLEESQHFESSEGKIHLASIQTASSDDTVGIYMRPSEEADLMGRFHSGGEFAVFGEMEDFYLVYNEEYQGFVRKENLQLSQRFWSQSMHRFENALGYGIVRTGAYEYAPLLRCSDDNGEYIVGLAKEGDAVLISNQQDGWAQVYAIDMQNDYWIQQVFIQSQYLQMIPIASFQMDASESQSGNIELKAGTYTVGRDLLPDMYSFDVPTGAQATLTVTTAEGNVVTHNPVCSGQYPIYTVYLPEGASVVVEGDGVLTNMDKTVVRVVGTSYEGGFGRYVGGVHIDETNIFIKLLPEAQEGYYRVTSLEMEAQGIMPETVAVRPGEEILVDLGYGTFLEFYNCIIWTNG